jgi:hypothetical protein
MIRSGETLSNIRERRLLEWRTELARRIRERKLRALAGLRERLRVLTERIEAIEDALGLVGWYPSHRKDGVKHPYPEHLIRELCALAPAERAQRIRRIAEERGIDRKSVYRNLAKCPAWSLRDRLAPLDERWISPKAKALGA